MLGENDFSFDTWRSTISSKAPVPAAVIENIAATTARMDIGELRRNLFRWPKRDFWFECNCRYSASYGGGSEYGGSNAGGSYGRRTSRQPHAHEVQQSVEYDESKAVLAVFNLSIYTTEAELYDIFTKFGPLKKATVVIDAKVGFDPG